MLGQLPQLGRDWVLLKKEANKEGGYERSWATFSNRKNGDLFSFAADRYANTKRTIRDDPVREAATDMFAGGFPKYMRDQTDRRWVTATIRFNVITLETGVDTTHKNVAGEVLEYSHVYESQSHSEPNRLGHGYALAFGDTCIFVQHTSSHVITPDDARSAALLLLLGHSASRPQ